MSCSRMKNRGIMDCVRQIPVQLRCDVCAGFGFVYRSSARETRIEEKKCGACAGTGRRS